MLTNKKKSTRHLIYVPMYYISRIVYEWKYIQVFFVAVLLCGVSTADSGVAVPSTQDVSGLRSTSTY